MTTVESRKILGAYIEYNPNIGAPPMRVLKRAGIQSDPILVNMTCKEFVEMGIMSKDGEYKGDTNYKINLPKAIEYLVYGNTCFGCSNPISQGWDRWIGDHRSYCKFCFAELRKRQAGVTQ